MKIRPPRLAPGTRIRAILDMTYDRCMGWRLGSVGVSKNDFGWLAHGVCWLCGLGRANTDTDIMLNRNWTRQIGLIRKVA